MRYSGSFPDPAQPGATLPRVRFWEPWNEANIPAFFSAPDAAGAYRNLLDTAYRQLKSIHGDNLVLMGGFAAVSPVPNSVPPLNFAAELMCQSLHGSRWVTIHGCQPAHFDALAAHPYSIAATPTKHAFKRGDLIVGDIGTLRGLLRAAGRVAHRYYPLWVTEFGWYTNPPNTQIGDPPKVAARYVEYALYEMWKAGASVVIWYSALELTGDNFAGAGLYSAPGQPKSTLGAMAFPFVAGVRRGSGFGWGRAPTSGGRRVIVERAAGRRWVRVATARTGSDGVFYVRFGARGNGFYRAHVSGGPTSFTYNSRPIPPKRTHLFNLF